MHRPGVVRFTAPFVAAFWIVAFLAAPAFAASTLSGVRIDPLPTGGALVSVSFNGGAPAYHLVGAGTVEASLIFDGAALGQVPPTIAGAGPVTSVSIAQTGASSSIALHLTSPVGVRVRTGGGLVFIDVAPAGGAAANPLAALGGGFAAAAPANGTGLGPVTEVVPLKYADISEIAGVLVAGSNVASNDTFTPTQTNIGTSSLTGSFGGISGGGFGQTALPQNFNNGQFGQTLGVAQRVNDNIAVDRRLNAIILSGTPDVVASLRVLIDKLDVPVQSVILETQIVELSDTAARNIGLDFSPSGSGVVVDASGSGNGLTVHTGGTSTTAGAPSTTITSQYSVTANLYAAVSEGNAKIIAKPRILAQSGQQASILTGDAIPIVTQVVVASAGAISGQQVNYVNVGVNLQIQPRVSSDGFVTSHIYSEVSSVTQFVSGIPQISQRTATTTATVRDGEAFVIGGLLQDNEIRNLTKLPFIGDIPVIGQFFRHVNTSHSQTNLYIVVTPHVVGANAIAPAISPLAIPSSLPQVAPPPAPGSPASSPQPLAAPTGAPAPPKS